MERRSSPYLRLAAVIVATALASPSPAGSGEDAPARWRPGERLDYTVSLGPIPNAAQARVETVSSAGGRTDRLRLRAEAKAGPLLDLIYPFHYVLLSTAAAPGMTPLHSSQQRNERGESSLLSLTFEHEAGRVLLSDRAGAEPFASAAIGRDTRDLLTALFHARSIPPAEDAGFTLFEDGLYRIRLHRRGVEELDLPAGRFEAVRYAVDAVTTSDRREVGDVFLWLSNDHDRLPLKLTAGTVLGDLVAELSSWKEPGSED